jgi:hypothetical protein
MCGGDIAILRAIAEKLIPGISYATRIALLQQTEHDEHDGNVSDHGGQNELSNLVASSLKLDGDAARTKNGNGRTVLQQVMASDEARNEITRDIQSMYPCQLPPLSLYSCSS